MAACGPIRYDGPTAIIVKVLLAENSGIRVLYLSGVDTTPVNVFPSVYRPEASAAADLPTGETVRVLLDDSMAGKRITVTVVGLDDTGDAIASGSSEVTVVARAESSLTVSLITAPADAGADGGSDAGLDGGTKSDGGVDGGGPSQPCRCTTGCCDENGDCAADAGYRAVSGVVGQVCAFACDSLRADHYNADAGTCACGAHNQCGAGVRCEGGQCLCDQRSNCGGCCDSAGSSPVCIGKGTQPLTSCGAGGAKCDKCEKSCTGGTCAACTPNPGQCCSGASQDTVAYPTCTSLQQVCIACDLQRSSSCGPLNVGCACGLKAACAATEVCVNKTCQPILPGK
jgi:hypothetical protein